MNEPIVRKELVSGETWIVTRRYSRTLGCHVLAEAVLAYSDADADAKLNIARRAAGLSELSTVRKE